MIELSVNQLWRHGPEWLGTKLISQEDTDSVSMLEECATEMNVNSQPSHNLLTPNAKQTIHCGDNGLPQLQDPVTITTSDSVCSQSCEEIQGWLYRTYLLYSTLTTKELSRSERQ